MSFAVEPASGAPITRLVTYGTLSPGGPNHYRLKHVLGTWSKGTIKGTLKPHGWGAAMGYPAVHIHPDGETMDVWMLESQELEGVWGWLDEFEGAEYERVAVWVSTEDGGRVRGWIYALKGVEHVLA